MLLWLISQRLREHELVALVSAPASLSYQEKHNTAAFLSLASQEEETNG